MADETNNNEATELVGDHVETVDVSKHPDPSIPVTDLSLADIERRQSHPVPWAVFIVAVLAAIIAPYWLGRSLAVGHTQWLITHLNLFTPRGVAFVSWTVTLTTFTGLVSPWWSRATGCAASCSWSVWPPNSSSPA